jgi:hypothetical protein
MKVGQWTTFDLDTQTITKLSKPVFIVVRYLFDNNFPPVIKVMKSDRIMIDDDYDNAIGVEYLILPAPSCQPGEPNLNYVPPKEERKVIDKKELLIRLMHTRDIELMGQQWWIISIEISPITGKIKVCLKLDPADILGGKMNIDLKTLHEMITYEANLEA